MIVAIAGVALFQGAVWARAVAVVVASLSILASFFWMPYYPIWSLTVIAFDAFVIWAVTVHGRDITGDSADRWSVTGRRPGRWSLSPPPPSP